MCIQTEAIVVQTVGNQPDVRARSGRERLHHGAEVAEIGAISGLHILSSVEDTNSGVDIAIPSRNLLSRSDGLSRIVDQTKLPRDIPKWTI